MRLSSAQLLQAYCRHMESHLATIANKDEDDFLRGHAIRRGKADSYWLGATDLNLEGRWLWEGRRPMVYSNWSPRQPDNYKGTEHCLEMRRSYSNYLWNDVPCYAFNVNEVNLENRQAKTIASDIVTQNHTQYQSQSNTDLLDACKNGDMCQVKYLLSEGHADINTRGQNGMTPLMLAAQNAHRQVFDFLVGQGARVEMSILHVACEGGNVPIVKYVFEQNVTDINSRRRDGSTAGMLAVFRGHGDVFNLLVSKGADPTLFDDKGSTYVDLAIQGGNTEIVEYVLKHNSVDINRKHCGLTPVMLAAVNGKLGVFNFLVQKGADLPIMHADHETILTMACKGGNIEIVKYALEQNIDAMSSNGMDGNAAAVIAAKMGRRDIFDLLVKKGANLTIKEENNNILLMACERGNVDIVKYVLKQNIVDINSKNEAELTPAMVAASWGHKEVFDLLISEGADMTHVSDYDDNILHLACYGGNVDIVKYVLKQNSLDINSKDDDDRTPAEMAISGGHRDILYLLVREGANLTQRDYQYRNVLHVACTSKQTKIAKYLITNTTVDINSESNDGTLVMLAALQGLGEVFDLLVSKGADLRSVTAHQENILHLACYGLNVEIEKYILSQNIVDDINSRNIVKYILSHVTIATADKENVILENKDESGYCAVNELLLQY